MPCATIVLVIRASGTFVRLPEQILRNLMLGIPAKIQTQNY
jgi:hypothetical protein